MRGMKGKEGTFANHSPLNVNVYSTFSPLSTILTLYPLSTFLTIDVITFNTMTRMQTEGFLSHTENTEFH